MDIIATGLYCGAGICLLLALIYFVDWLWSLTSERDE